MIISMYPSLNFVFGHKQRIGQKSSERTTTTFVGSFEDLDKMAGRDGVYNSIEFLLCGRDWGGGTDFLRTWTGTPLVELGFRCLASIGVGGCVRDFRFGIVNINLV